MSFFRGQDLNFFCFKGFHYLYSVYVILKELSKDHIGLYSSQTFNYIKEVLLLNWISKNDLLQRCYQFNNFRLFSGSFQNLKKFNYIFQSVNLLTGIIFSYISLFVIFNIFNARTFLIAITISSAIATPSWYVTILNHVFFILAVKADKFLLSF